MPKPITNISQLDLSKQYTYADYLLWQFSDRVELIKGWVYKMTPAPRRKHQRISADIHFSLMSFLKKNKKKCQIFYAPFDVRLINNKGEHNEITTVVQPDICIICDLEKLDERGCVGAPDLIIEILSPSTTIRDTQDKYFLYQENQVKEYWIVNPDAKSIEVFLLDENDKYQSVGIYNELDGFTEVPVNIFPKLTLQLKEIFEE